MSGAAQAGGAGEGPVVQAIGVAFVVFRVATVLLALAWAAGNIFPVPPGTQALVLRFGRVVRVQQAGLVLALPRPIEQVVTLPSAERQFGQLIDAGTGLAAGLADEAVTNSDIPGSAGTFLTGDGGVVLLDTTITWHITDAATYYVMQAHVAPALRRLFLDAGVSIAARHELDDFLAVRPERANDALAQAARAAVRGELVAAMNASLLGLTRQGEGLGIEITRADVTAMLPPDAKNSFDAVLEAAQRADQGLAAARTDAEHTRQQGDRDRDRILTGARAAATERLERARTTTASLTALEARMDQTSRPALLTGLYRERIAAILKQAGGVSTIDAKAVSRVILSGAQP